VLVKLSQATLYTMRALVYLARQEGNQPVPSQVIAQAEGIPEKFLSKGLGSLAETGVLHSLRGPNGGYCLAHNPKDITLLAVTEAVDGPLAQPMSITGGGDGLTERLQTICDRATEAVRRQYQKVRLADLVGTG
jgi:Rrf2 family protein